MKVYTLFLGALVYFLLGFSACDSGNSSSDICIVNWQISPNNNYNNPDSIGAQVNFEILSSIEVYNGQYPVVELYDQQNGLLTTSQRYGVVLNLGQNSEWFSFYDISANTLESLMTRPKIVYRNNTWGTYPVDTFLLKALVCL